MTSTVAVLGTGIMGAAMARNLAGAGMAVRAWNRTREKAQPLAEDGVAVADTPARAAEGADFLITTLSDADAAEAVSGGALPALAEGAVWLQTSTVGEAGTDRLARLAAEHGVAYVDAPVLGTRAPAERGQLVVLASGPEDVRERCGPVFGAVGGKTVWLGEAAGAGSRLKLVVNNWVVGLVGVLSETIALSRALEVDPGAFLDTIEGGPLGLPYARVKGKMMIEEDFPASFSARMAGKDAGLILEAASSHGLRMVVAEAVAARLGEAVGAGRGEEDLAAVYLAVVPGRL